MKRIDLFYQNINKCITDLSSELDVYYAANTFSIESSEQRATRYADFFSDLGKIQQFIIESYRTKNELIEDNSNIDNFISAYRTFIGLFSDFPLNIVNVFTFWSKVSDRLVSIKEPDLDLSQHIDISHFKLIDLEERIIESNFIHLDETTISKSLIVFALDLEFERFLIDDIHSAHTDILFLWLNFIDFKNTTSDKQYVIIKQENEIDLKDLKSILKLQVLLNGQEIKSLEKYDKVPTKPHLKDFDYSEKYIQFDSISNVLNEYNNQQNLLDKFLKLYHVIENFMYKHKVCELQRVKSGSPFYIRDFQTIYDRFSTTENKCIQEFFTKVLSLDYNGSSILTLLKNEWTNLEVLDSSKITEINSLFIALSFKDSYQYEKLKTILDGNVFAIIIYKIRNSIVHNKDSEFHFESTNLPSGAKFILENFFIPNMERIVFHLIINKNDLVWYENRELYLYEA